MHRALKAIRDYSGPLALLLVVGGLAAAATGDPLKLGQSNSANKPTAIQNSGTGAVLDLKAKSGQPPLKVNSDTKVRSLNADKLDGRDVSALALAAAVYTKAQADARFAAAGAAYTRAQADARYGQLLVSTTYSGETGPDAGDYAFYSRTVQVPRKGFVEFLAEVQSADNASTLHVGPEAFVIISDQVPKTFHELIPVEAGPLNVSVTMYQPGQVPVHSAGFLAVVFYPLP